MLFVILFCCCWDLKAKTDYVFTKIKLHYKIENILKTNIVHETIHFYVTCPCTVFFCCVSCHAERSVDVWIFKIFSTTFYWSYFAVSPLGDHCLILVLSLDISRRTICFTFCTFLSPFAACHTLLVSFSSAVSTYHFYFFAKFCVLATYHAVLYSGCFECQI